MGRTAFLAVMGLILSSGIAMVSGTAQAEKSWSALGGKHVIVTQKGGEEVKGLLSFVGSSLLIVRTDAGKVLKIQADDIAAVRARPAAETPAPPPEPLAPAPAKEAPASTGPLSEGDFKALALVIRSTPDDALPSLLREDGRVPRTTAAQRLLLLEGHKEPGWKAGVGFALNFLLAPGLGSLVQGDWKWGLPLLAGTGLGAGLIFGSKSPSAATAGYAVLLVAWIVGMVRPWTYDGGKHGVLKDFLTAELGGVRASPYVFVEQHQPLLAAHTIVPKGTSAGGGLRLDF